MKYVIAPSILSADFTKLGEEIKVTEENGATYLHYDVMDGMFVPNISFGMPVMKSIRKATNQVLDAHLMVEDPIRYIEDFKNAGADSLTVHLEACPDVKAALDKIKSLGMKVGLSICPETPVESLKEYINDLDLILIMTVHPGKGGQKFIPESREKIKKTREMIKETGRDIDLQVDGGISCANVEELMELGANNFVAGSSVFGGDIAENVKAFVEIFKKHE